MKILSIVGARPQFVKSAIFRKACVENDIDEVLFHTGQHYDTNMSDVFFTELGVQPPEYRMSLEKRSHGGMTAEILQQFEELIIQEKPDVVNVFGDTNSTLAGALAASKLHVPISHIEAGLRSFNKKMPEEVNRILTDHVSDYLFCPTLSSVENLARENILQNVFHVGDIMFDCVKQFSGRFVVPKVVGKAAGKKIATMTMHRVETVNDPDRLLEVIEFCKSFTNEFLVVFPVHPNTAKKIKDAGISLNPICAVDPLSYLEMQGLLSVSALVLTDSGGLQKEAYFHRVDCITLREETEWVETVEAGWNRLWRNLGEGIEKSEIADFGSGHACADIIKKLS